MNFFLILKRTLNLFNNNLRQNRYIMYQIPPTLNVLRTHFRYPPVGLGDGRILVIFRVDGQIYGHGRSSPSLFGVYFTPRRWWQVFWIRPRRQVRWRSWRWLFGWWRWSWRSWFIHSPLPRVWSNLQQVQQADYLVEFVFLQKGEYT